MRSILTTPFVKGPLPIIDKALCETLYEKALREPLDNEVGAKWQERDMLGYGVWLYKEYGVFLPPCYVCIFTVDRKINRKTLSVTAPLLPVTITTEIMEKIGAEFGMGDHREWSGRLPPDQPKQMAYYIYKDLETNHV